MDAAPLAEDSVGAAVANMVLHHAPDPTGMITEIARVGLPSGIVAVCDEVEHSYARMRTELVAQWHGSAAKEVERS